MFGIVNPSSYLTVSLAPIPLQAVSVCGYYIIPLPFENSNLIEKVIVSRDGVWYHFPTMDFPFLSVRSLNIINYLWYFEYDFSVDIYWILFVYHLILKWKIYNISRWNKSQTNEFNSPFWRNLAKFLLKGNIKATSRNDDAFCTITRRDKIHISSKANI